MEDNKRFEDNISVDDLMKLDEKTLMTKIYVQVLKTNGTVRSHDKDIECLQNEIKDKIGWKMFTILISAVSFLIILFNVLDLVMR